MGLFALATACGSNDILVTTTTTSTAPTTTTSTAPTTTYLSAPLTTWPEHGQSITPVEGQSRPVLEPTLVIINTNIGDAWCNEVDFADRTTEVCSQRPFTHTEWGSLAVGDLDNDGYSDDLLNSAGFSEVSLGLEGLRESLRVYRDVRLADLDADGVVDAIANVYQEEHGFVRLYWGHFDDLSGSLLFTEDVDFSANEYRGFGESIVVADLNNDNLLDIFVPQYVEDGIRANIYNYPLLFENLDDRRFFDHSLTSGFANPIQRVEGAQAFDFNHDGLLDIYTGGALWLNRGSFTFVALAEPIGLDSTIQDEGIEIVDVDADGRPELILLDPNGILFIYEITCEPCRFTLEASYSVARSDTFGLTTIQFDGDEQREIVVTGGKSVIDEQEVFHPPTLVDLSGVEPVASTLLSHHRGWSDIGTWFSPANDCTENLVLRYERVFILEGQYTQKCVVLTVLIDGKKTAQGRDVISTQVNGRTAWHVIDGGSGFLSQKPYELYLSLDPQSDWLDVQVGCPLGISESIRLSEGAWTFDCDNYSLSART